MTRAAIKRLRAALAASAAALLLAAAAAPRAAAAQQTSAVSRNDWGVLGDRVTRNASISADGRFVAFMSNARNLVPGDTNEIHDVFVHDRRTGRTTRVSVDSAGAQSNAYSDFPSISADGRFVAFESWADNLVPNDTNQIYDCFVHDRQTGSTTRVSVDSSGRQANDASSNPAISADGNCVAFYSRATNLVPGDTNGTYDIFVHDGTTGATTRVSRDSSGVQANAESTYPAISADGRFAAYASAADNLVPGDANGAIDVFVHDRLTGFTERVSVDSLGAEGNGECQEPSLTGDGRLVTFVSRADNLVPGDTNGMDDAFVHDRLTGATTRVSVDSSGVQADGRSYFSSISNDGRFVAFASEAANLVPGDGNGDWDVFVHDRLSGTTTRVSVDSLGAEGNGSSSSPTVSADGRHVAFTSDATNLVPGDLNGETDAFVHVRGPGTAATENGIVLAGNVFADPGQPVRFSWFAAPPGAHAWLLGSWSGAGSTIGGHVFGVGPGAQVIAHGSCTARGTGSFTTLPLPAWTSGRTFYVEVGAQDAAGVIHDSNTIERFVR